MCQKMRKKRQKNCLMISKKKMHKLLTGLGEYQIVVLTISYAYSKKSCDGLKKRVMEVS